LVSLPSEGVTFPMKAKYNYANRTIQGEEDHLEEMENLQPPEHEADGPLPDPAPVENQCQDPLPGTTMSLVAAGDLYCMVINNPNCDRFYLPDDDELVAYGGPMRDQIVARITFDNSMNTEIRGREDIPLKKDGHDDYVGPIPNGPRDITTSLYWHKAPRGVPRPIPQAKTFVKETTNAKRYQVPSKKMAILSHGRRSSGEKRLTWARTASS